jgi:Protein of unknown function with HXXEE motif
MLSKKQNLWLVPIVMTAHNLEEAVFMPAFLKARNNAIPDFLTDLLPAITYRQFLIAVVVATLIPYAIAMAGNLGQERSAAVYLLLGLQVVMLFNVLAHLVMTAIMGGYAPGVATALLLNLPFSLYLLRRAARERWVTVKAIALMFPVGFVVHCLGLPGLIILAGNL